MQLSTLVTGNTYRNPTLLGKAVTTLDVVSAGRAILGIGELERRQLGFEFGTFTERFEKLEEALRDRGVVTGAALALALALLVLPPSATSTCGTADGFAVTEISWTAARLCLSTWKWTCSSAPSSAHALIAKVDDARAEGTGFGQPQIEGYGERREVRGANARCLTDC